MSFCYSGVAFWLLMNEFGSSGLIFGYSGNSLVCAYGPSDTQIHFFSGKFLWNSKQTFIVLKFKGQNSKNNPTVIA